MIFKKLLGNKLSIRKTKPSLEDQKLELRFKAEQLGLDVVEQDEVLSALYFTEQLNKLITEQQTASTYKNNEDLTNLPLEYLEIELTRIMYHAFTLLRALSWSVKNGSLYTAMYANAVTGFISDTLHNAPSLLRGKLFAEDNDEAQKLRLANIILEYVSLLTVLKEHLEQTKLDGKIRHDIWYYYTKFHLTDY